MRLLLLLASAAAISKVPKAPTAGRAVAISSKTPQKPTTGRAAAKADPKPLALSGGGNKKQVSYAWAVLHNWLYFLSLGLCIPVLPKVIASTVNEGTRATPVAGTSVQVGAYPRRADAEAAWSNLMRQTEALNGVSHRVVEAQVDIGTVYRLQAITGDRASASRLGAALKADGLACFVK